MCRAKLGQTSRPAPQAPLHPGGLQGPAREGPCHQPHSAAPGPALPFCCSVSNGATGCRGSARGRNPEPPSHLRSPPLQASGPAGQGRPTRTQPGSAPPRTSSLMFHLLRSLQTPPSSQGAGRWHLSARGQARAEGGRAARLGAGTDKGGPGGCPHRGGHGDGPKWPGGKLEGEAFGKEPPRL